MDKLRMQTLDGVQDNIDKIAALFPNCITERKDAEGKVTLAIDFDKLRQELSSEIVEGREERYQFTWPDKKKAILLANSPINATLRPCREESVDFDNTQNLYIEGDNLDVLKCLKETYLGKVKMIYIDPPYNTGNDFVYEDNFAESTSEYLANSGQYDEQGNRLVNNTESNGRFHTDWLNMIYPRLKVARELLTEDGVIFISVDDNEVENLKIVCNEIFGESNFVATCVWKRRASSAMDRSNCSMDHEYVLSYQKGSLLAFNGIEKDYKGYSNPDNDPRGPWTTGDLTVGMTGDMRPNQYYDLVDPSTGKIYKPNYNRVWSYIPESMQKLIEENRIVFPEDTNQRPMKKRFASELIANVNPFSTWMSEIGMNTEGTRVLNSLLGASMFNYSKPITLCTNLLKQVSHKNAIILDFFSGSATTAHAVMQLNAEDGGNRKFIMVQLPEITDKNSEAYKAGYNTICEIGKERIRRAGKKIKNELAAKQQENGLFTEQEEKQTLDIGFRVVKLDSSNMADIYYSPAEYDQQTLFSKAENIKPDRTSEDLLFQVMLELGATLDSKIERVEIENKTIYNVANDYLVACFDNEINDSVVTAIAKMQPQYAVFRDSSMADDSTATNFEQIFKTYSPNTTTKVL